MKRERGWVWVLSFVLTAPWSTSAEEVVIGAAKDNTLYEDANGALSNGAGQYVFAGRVDVRGGGLLRRALIEFDVADHVPAGSTINTVELTLHLSRVHFDSGPEIASLHALEKEWGEGASDALGEEGGGAASEPGDATWIHTFFDTDFWTDAGGDFANVASASATTEGIGFYTWGSTDDMVANVQAWLDAPDENHGWILLGNEETLASAKRYDSRENPTAEFRPGLRVDFTPPPCGGDEKIKKAKCKTKNGEVKKLKVLVTGAVAGNGYVAILDSGESLAKTANNQGKATFTFSGDDAPPCGLNAVTVCGLRKDFDCGC